MKEMKQYFQNKYIKIGVAVIILVIILYSIFYTYHYFKGKAQSVQYQGLQKATGQNVSLTPQQLDGLSAQIYAALNEWGSNDVDSVINAFSQLNNDADYYALLANFGTKTWGIVIKDSYTLIQAIHSFLSPDEVSKINTALQSKGIKETL